MDREKNRPKVAFIVRKIITILFHTLCLTLYVYIIKLKSINCQQANVLWREHKVQNDANSKHETKIYNVFDKTRLLRSTKCTCNIKFVYMSSIYVNVLEFGQKWVSKNYLIISKLNHFINQFPKTSDETDKRLRLQCVD